MLYIFREVLILALLCKGWKVGCLPLPSQTVVDLTHAMGESAITWPSNDPFAVTKIFRDRVSDVQGGYWYESRDFSQAEHSGTHLDAPAHFSEGKWRVDQIPVSRLIGPGVKVDISVKARELGLDSVLELEDLEIWEIRYGLIPHGAVVIVHTGHGRLYHNRTAYLGYPEDLEVLDNDTENLHFPGVGEEAARWLVKERGIIGLGIDTPSTDFGQSREFLTHQVLGASNVWGVENLARTDQLPPAGFDVLALVHKLEGGSGGPARVVAVLENGSGDATMNSGSAGTATFISIFSALTLVYCF